MFQRKGGADAYLDFFSGAFTYHHVIGAFHVCRDRGVKLVPAHPQAAAEDDAGEGDDCDFASPAADIHDHIARRFMHRQTDANGRGHRLFDQVHLTRAGVGGRILHSPFFNFRDARRHGHDDTWRNQFTVMNLLDEMPQHGLGDFEVGDHAVFHRADSHDVAGRAAQHPFGFVADGEHVGRARLDGHHRRFAQDDSTIPHIDEAIGSAQIYSNVVGKQAFELCKHEICLLTAKI